MEIRSVSASDYHVIAPLVNDWWEGRQVIHMLPKLFFDHFSTTSFVAEEEGEIIGFLIGFLSQANMEEAYIHFVGVDPDYRNFSVGTKLYNKFIEVVTRRGNRRRIKCVISPQNHESLSFHTKIGFEMIPGDQEINGISIHSNYDGPGQDRIVFIKRIKTIQSIT